MTRVVVAGLFALASAAGGCSGCADDPPGASSASPVRPRPRSALVGSRALRAAVADAGADSGARAAPEAPASSP